MQRQPCMKARKTRYIHLVEKIGTHEKVKKRADQQDGHARSKQTCKNKHKPTQCDPFCSCLDGLYSKRNTSQNCGTLTSQVKIAAFFSQQCTHGETHKD